MRASQKLSSQEYRWRQVLVQKVKNYWIEGVLERSLHNQVLIELGLEENSQAVSSPISGVEEFEQEAKRRLPKGTQASDFFDNLGAGRTLLILGEPGSGKTITLLKIAESLIKRAENDLSQPLPVVLNLSSWSISLSSVQDWLIQELNRIYGLSKALSRNWIKGEQLILLLDGLDEVTFEHRGYLLSSINKFIQEYGCIEMVICSRIKDYELIRGYEKSNRLNLQSSICVMPLTDQQIDHYLQHVGEKLIGLKALFRKNPEIKGFASSPLTLSILSLAFQNFSVRKASRFKAVESFGNQLFDAYVERMLTRRGTTQLYTNEKTRLWLIGLSRHMQESSQSLFLVEQMQLDWLQTGWQRFIYRLLCSTTVGMTCGLLSGILSIVYNPFSRAYPSLVTLVIGTSVGVITGIVAFWRTLSNSRTIEFIPNNVWSWKRVVYGLKEGFGIGLIGALLNGLFFLVIDLILISKGISGQLIASFLGGCINGVMIGSSGGLVYAFTQSSPGPDIEFQSVYSSRLVGKYVRNSLLSCFIGALAAPLFFWSFFVLTRTLFSLLGVIFAPESVMDSAQAIQLVSNQTILVGKFGDIDPSALKRIYLIVSGIGGSAGIMGGGGKACIQHFILRLILFANGQMPWNYSRFLDYGVERLFLQRVGSGYIFIHRMLMEHFASMELDTHGSLKNIGE